ncbi:MAG: hypothetical protein V4857_06245, partial [Pseudomonadota bacterium]
MQTRTDGDVYERTADATMSACRVLFPGLWDTIEAKFGDPVVIAVPHRAAVYFCRSVSLHELRDLAEIAKSLASNTSNLHRPRACGEACLPACAAVAKGQQRAQLAFKTHQ